MKFYGLDLANKNDNFAITEMEMQGSYKAPCPHDVIYVLKDCKTFETDTITVNGLIWPKFKTNKYPLAIN